MCCNPNITAQTKVWKMTTGWITSSLETAQMQRLLQGYCIPLHCVVLFICPSLSPETKWRCVSCPADIIASCVDKSEGFSSQVASLCFQLTEPTVFHSVCSGKWNTFVSINMRPYQYCYNCFIKPLQWVAMNLHFWLLNGIRLCVRIIHRSWSLFKEGYQKGMSQCEWSMQTCCRGHRSGH